jgi:hypothetical protein
MVDSSEQRRLIACYREPRNARAVVARCAAGLLIVAVIAIAGASYSDSEAPETARVNAPRVASGR